MDYVDGVTSSVLQHPYTIVHDFLGDSFFVASFTLNHVVRLRMASTRSAQYKVFVSGSELDGPVGMVVDGDVLFVASFTNDHVLRVNTTDGALLSRFGDSDILDCPEGIALNPHDGRLYVASFLLPHLAVFDPQSGAHLGSFGQSPRSSAAVPRPLKLHGAEDVAFDFHGAAHVTAYYSEMVHGGHFDLGRRVRQSSI